MSARRQPRKELGGLSPPRTGSATALFDMQTPVSVPEVAVPSAPLLFTPGPSGGGRVPTPHFSSLHHPTHTGTPGGPATTVAQASVGPMASVSSWGNGVGASGASGASGVGGSVGHVDVTVAGAPATATVGQPPAQQMVAGASAEVRQEPFHALW
jgi:hypothetical protein